MRCRVVSFASKSANLALVLALMCLAGCGWRPGVPDDDPKLMTIRLTSSAFAEGGDDP